MLFVGNIRDNQDLDGIMDSMIDCTTRDILPGVRKIIWQCADATLVLGCAARAEIIDITIFILS